jgi:hypothetical protein
VKEIETGNCGSWIGSPDRDAHLTENTDDRK